MGRIFYGQTRVANLGRGATLMALLVGLIGGLFVASQVTVLLWGAPPLYRPFLDLRSFRWVLLPGALALLATVVVNTWRYLRQPLADDDEPNPTAKVLLAGGIALGCVYAAYWPIWGWEPALHLIFRTRSYRMVGLGLWTAGALLSGGMLYAIVYGNSIVRPSHARGSNRWGQGLALRRNKTGLILGEKDGEFLRYSGDGHLLTVAATRSGKGVSGIIPNLLEYPGSIVVTDPKAENFFVTARYRAQQLDQYCVALDPFDLVDEKIAELHERYPELKDRVIKGSFNPLDLMRPDDVRLLELAKMFSEMLVPKGNTKEPFWEIEAAALIETFILHLVTNLEPGDPRRSLIELRRMLSMSGHEQQLLLTEMQQSSFRAVAEGANRIKQKADKELSGVLSTAHSHTHFLGSEAMERVLSASNFDMFQLLEGNLTLYLILPAEQLQVFARWLRLMFAAAYYVVTKDATKRGGLTKRVLFLMDEFANLGRLDFMSNLISLGAGYGVTAWMILQDLSQLKREYEREWESFIANVDVIQAFGISDSWTAEQISKLIGETTVLSQSLNVASPQESKIRRYRVNYSETNRPLLRPDELRRLHPDDLVILAKPLYPVLAKKVRYFQHKYFRGKFDPNPLFEAKRKAQPSVVQTRTAENTKEESVCDPFA